MGRQFDKEKEHLWHERIKCWKCSDMNCQDWCSLHGFSYTRFLYWRRKLDVPPGKPVSEEIRSVFDHQSKIYLYHHQVDMRQSFDSLVALIEQHLPGLLFSKFYFAFLNRNKDKLKVLYWDGDGLAIWYKRLERRNFSPLNRYSQMKPKVNFILLD